MTRSEVRCDKAGCDNLAAWVYEVTYIDGLDDVHACQRHVKEIRETEGMNILSVRSAKRYRTPTVSEVREGNENNA